ncbi:MAG: branched-chain amino acid ABC transporter permease [Alphaproteobacteria bacterium]|jgi:branched-chain amino acid transport system permease protein|uniref:branched-chain amino acid ABC transporter permease n=1 Tax=Pacificispira sp. TaxID=2888761 RepID=UPI001B236FFF|nr:branched-chain amino acid ABC transporter permease [Alphaproteobacteria bacterium]MBO6864526.1 branched-chain amino acid ABC transporter permease [Alphaproteobacteria bacterium]MEC9266398.1 branched-chain amino acid ABC transporter permease [Pseudomonadota bacterium]
MWGSIEVLLSLPAYNVGLILNGLCVGAVFALAAYGLALVWGVMNVKNLAQGEFVIMGGYLAWYIAKTTGMNPLLTLPIVAVLMFVFGWAIYVLMIRRVVDKDLFTSLLATFGLAIVMQQALNLAFGPEVQVAQFGRGSVSMMGGIVSILEIKFWAFGMCILLAGAVVAFMKFSRMGQAIRATSQDARAARVMGINTDRVYAFTYALNSAICGAAGVLVAMIMVIQPYYGVTHSVRSFVIVTAAGIGNLPGVIMSALGLGVIEQYSGFVLGAEFQVATVVVMLLLVLIWRQYQASRIRQVVR